MLNSSFSQIVSLIATFSSLIAVGLGWATHKKLLRIHNAIWAFMFFTLGLETTGFILSRFHIFNTWLYHIYSIIESVVIFYFFREVLRIQNKIKLNSFILLLLVIFQFVNSMVFQPINSQLNSYSVMISNAFTVVYSILFLWHNMTSSDPIFKQSAFWVTISLLIYGACTFLVWFSFLSFPNNSRLISYLFFWNWVFTILKNLGFAYFLWKAPRI
ncbi:MAG TPA: hypothetical protein DCE41_05445 [Cytophagales bacterium]|nr:hypothetical protein [Cytophagales bacterium]HAA24399.1 hypothetical protein [Cytophagales bacterium]HAP62170.1 hypothetical protein [Cytophagales bacterium]